MKNRFMGLFLLMGGILCSAQEGQQIISTDFSGANMPSEIKLNAQWKMDQGTLKSNHNAFHSFQIRAADWTEYEIEFKIRCLEKFKEEQHFGFRFQSPDGVNHLYTRGDKLILWIPSRKLHAAFGVPFEKPLPVGEKSAWTSFRISVKNNLFSVQMNGKNIGETNQFPVGIDNLTFYSYNLGVEMDDLRIIVYSKGKKEGEKRSASPNLAMNASFEDCTLDHLPDYWGVPHWGISEPYWILNHDKWREYFRTDTSTAWHGKRSLRIENVKDSPVDSSLVMTSCNFGTKTGETYTFSAWMKSNQNGVKVRMFSENMRHPYNRAGKEITLTTEWKRYEYTYTRKDNTLYSDMLRIALLNKGVVWIDGIQLETGAQSSAFQLADADRRLIVHEGNTEKELFSVPVLNLPLKKATPVLDGRLSDAIWAQIPAVELKSVSGKEVKEKTTAKLFYTENGIYIGMDVQEANSNQMTCSKKQRDEYVWTDPSFEIFLDSKLTRGTYHHLGFNADGIRYDSNLGDSTWNGNWQVKTAKKSDGSGWTAEVFLPFGDFGIDYNNGPLWGFNLCRNNPRIQEISCWAPTYGRFHEPLRFGQLAIDGAIQKRYLTGIRNAEIQYAGDGKGELSFQVFNNTGKNRTVTVVADVKRADGIQKMRSVQTVEIPDKSVKTLTSETFSVIPGEACLLETSIREGATPLHYSSQKISSAKLLTALVQHDYYTSEKELAVRGRADLNHELLKQVTLELSVHGKNGVVHQEKSGLSTCDFEKKISIRNWKNDDYVMTARLLVKHQEIAKTESRFQKLPPSATEVKLDRFRRITVVNGKPFFPLGFFWEGPLTPELVEYLAGCGVNFLHTYNYTELIDNPKILDAGLKHGVMFQVDVRARRGKIADAISKLKHHPAILNWYTYDESFTTSWGRANLPEILQTIASGQKLDPYRPVIMLENSHGMNYIIEKNFEFPGKIPMIDVYVFPPAANVGTIDFMSKAILDLGRKDGSPGWFVLLASGYAFHASRDMTPPEHEYMAYICAVNGIRGISYWAAFPKSVTSIETLKRLFRELNHLKDVLISLEDVPKIGCHSDSIKFTVKKHQGFLYLIAVNESRNPVHAKFDFSGISAEKEVNVEFENRKIKMDNHTMSDSFSPLSRHVYKIALK